MKTTVFLTLSQHVSENQVKGIKKIEFTKEPISVYHTADGTERRVKGIKFCDVEGHQLMSMGLSDRLSKLSLMDIAKQVKTLTVRKDVVETVDNQNNPVTRTYFSLCSPAELEGTGEYADVAL